jgi:hypothetical protein
MWSGRGCFERSSNLEQDSLHLPFASPESNLAKAGKIYAEYAVNWLFAKMFGFAHALLRHKSRQSCYY